MILYHGVADVMLPARGARQVAQRCGESTKRLLAGVPIRCFKCIPDEHAIRAEARNEAFYIARIQRPRVAMNDFLYLQAIRD
jgi:hypothetical protein